MFRSTGPDTNKIKFQYKVATTVPLSTSDYLADCETSCSGFCFRKILYDAAEFALCCKAHIGSTSLRPRHLLNGGFTTKDSGASLDRTYTGKLS